MSKFLFHVYVVYDLVADMPVRILMFENQKVCLRFFENAFKVPNSPFSVNVKDTVLIDLCSFADDLVPIPSNQNFSFITTDDETGEEKKKLLNGHRVKAYDDLVKSLFIDNNNINFKKVENEK